MPIRDIISRLIGHHPARDVDAATSTTGAGGVTATGHPMVDNYLRVAGDIPAPQKKAVADLKQLVKDNAIQKYYDAYTGKTQDAELKQKAIDLFSALPSITADTAPADLVALGLITQVPKNIDKMLVSPRYVMGRQVMARTKIHTKTHTSRAFGQYDENGHEMITHKASIAGEEGDNFLVKVDGRDEPLKIPKSEIIKLNQPQDYVGTKFSLNGIIVDHDNPATKAKICEAMIKMDPILSSIDFEVGKEPARGGVAGFFSRNAANTLQEKQETCVRIVHDVIRMSYSHDMSSGDHVGKLAMGSNGQCYSQAAVMAGLLFPFNKLLGIDIRFINGKVFRNASGDPPNNGGNHGWLQVTYRPTMVTKITDRTWSQPSTAMDRAYSWSGDRWPFGLIGPRGDSLLPTQDTDIDVSGSTRVDMGDRQFGVAGVDDRSNHQ
ncbi:MAG: hypothetical protein V3T05_06800 [Myxococcota bacterium]